MHYGTSSLMVSVGLGVQEVFDKVVLSVGRDRPKPPTSSEIFDSDR